jgi:hypothetical protein
VTPSLKGAPREEASIAAIVGMADGVMRLADFIKDTGALPNLLPIRTRFYD